MRMLLEHKQARQHSMMLGRDVRPAWQAMQLAVCLHAHLPVQLDDIHNDAVLLKTTDGRAHPKPNCQCALAGPDQPAQQFASSACAA